MKTAELIEEIKKLSLSKRYFVIEKVISSIRENEDKDQINMAAEALNPYYRLDEKLTEFTDIDFEDFYETK